MLFLGRSILWCISISSWAAFVLSSTLDHSLLWAVYKWKVWTSQYCRSSTISLTWTLGPSTLSWGAVNLWWGHISTPSCAVWVYISIFLLNLACNISHNLVLSRGSIYSIISEFSRV
jgi:hypothetical protein